MSVLFKRFKSENSEIFKLYDETILKHVFEEVASFFNSDESRRFTDDDLLAYVIRNFKKKSIVFLPNANIMKPVLQFFLQEFRYNKDSYNDYHDEVKKIIWRSLSRNITNVSAYLDDLTDAILYELSMREESISTLDITNSIMEYPLLKALSFDVIHDTVETVYHYFVDKDLIQMVD